MIAMTDPGILASNPGLAVLIWKFWWLALLPIGFARLAWERARARLKSRDHKTSGCDQSAAPPRGSD